jgi:hypothetical protein
MFYDYTKEIIKECKFMTQQYSIGVFAKKAGVTIKTHHYYDEIGILKAIVPPSGRRFMKINLWMDILEHGLIAAILCHIIFSSCLVWF